MGQLCILCCFSYQPGGDGEVEVLRDNPILQEFCKDLSTDYSRLMNCLQNEWDQVSICGECLTSVETAVEVRKTMEEMEGEVRRLQRELLEKIRGLKDCVEGWQGELKRVEEIINGGDVGALGSRRRKTGRVNDEVTVFRTRIGEVVKEVAAFCGDLEVKTGGRTVDSGRKSLRKRKVKEEPPQFVEDLEDEMMMYFDGDLPQPEDDPLENVDSPEEEEEERHSSEYWDSGGNNSDEEEKRVKRKKKTRPKKGEKPGLLDPLKSLKTRKWSPFKLRFITRLLKRNNGSFTAPQLSPEDVAPQGVPAIMSYDPSTDKFFIKDIEILIKDDNHRTIPGGGYIECSLCPFTAKPSFNPKKGEYTDDHNDRQIIVHVNGRHLNAYHCPLCLKSFFSPSRYQEHLKSHQGQLDCPICGKPCATKDTLADHQWSHMNAEEVEQAKKSGARLPKQWLNKQKLQNESTESSYVCPTCGKQLKSPKDLRNHEKTHLEVRETVICPKCGKQMLKESYIVYHKKNCSADPVVQGKVHCLVCNACVKNKRFLQRHMKIKHSQEALERNWCCELCSKRFKTQAELKTHLKIHGEGHWTCECGREFNVKRYWNKHKKQCLLAGGNVKQDNN